MRTSRLLLMVWMAGAALASTAAPISARAEAAAGAELDGAGGGDKAGREGLGFTAVLRQSGPMGMMLWAGLLAISVAGLWLVIDSFVTIQHQKIVPVDLVRRVREAMEQGDVMKAMEHCDKEPGPLATILSSGFSNVVEGFDVVQDAIAVTADLEGEKMMQRVSYLNLVGNLSPMLGLLGTVQGMIYAFQNLGVGAGASTSSLLALNISQALFTTAAGLAIAVPAVGFYYFFRNRATNIILGMEGLTLDLVKALRNVEIVEA